MEAATSRVAGLGSQRRAWCTASSTVHSCRTHSRRPNPRRTPADTSIAVTHCLNTHTVFNGHLFAAA